jgi:hypothetical protein
MWRVCDWLPLLIMLLLSDARSASSRSAAPAAVDDAAEDAKRDAPPAPESDSGLGIDGARIADALLLDIVPSCRLTCAMDARISSNSDEGASAGAADALPATLCTTTATRRSIS